MRIALVTESFVPSSSPGARVTRELVGRLVGRGHDVVVFAGGRGRASFGGARVFWASRMTPVSAIREALALSRADLCHLVEPQRLGLKVAEAADRLGVPTVVLKPGTWQPGVDLDHHHPGLRDPALGERWAHSPAGRQVVVGYAGSLERTKDVRRLAAVARLPGVRLVAVGTGRGADLLRAAGAKVVPPASDVELAVCTATFDVLISPRRHERLAPTVLEALASGVPVVAHDRGRAPGIVEHEHNGLLVHGGRGGKALREAVARLATSPDLRSTLAANARASVSEHSWDRAVSELVDVHYAGAAKGCRAASVG